MGENGLIYADAVTNLDEADVVILGVPFDATSSHRSGSAAAPGAIRKESYNLETYSPKYHYNVENLKFHDMGDAKGYTNVLDMIESLPKMIGDIIDAKKFLIALGGEHSVTVPIVKTLTESNQNQELGIVYFDAHMDLRDSYLDEKYSHAAVARRLCDIVGPNNIVWLGVRSWSEEEEETIKKLKPRFYTADKVNELGMRKIIKESLAYLGKKKIYLSIDMDVFDPSYAPGVGNPEYFGLSPWQLRDAIEILAPYLIGADIVEVSPPVDSGNTAALAAQIIHLIIGLTANKKNTEQK